MIKKFSQFLNESKELLVLYHGTNANPKTFKLDPDLDWADAPGNAWDIDLPDGVIFLTNNKAEAKHYGKNILKFEVDPSDILTIQVNTSNPSKAFDDDYNYGSKYNLWQKFQDSDKSILAIKGNNKTTYIAYFDAVKRIEEAFLNESRRKEKTKIDLTSIKYAYHWVNEGNLFEQLYDCSGIDTLPFVLRKKNGKKIEMPQLPKEQFIFGDPECTIKNGYAMQSGFVCMTVDPSYLQAGMTGENNFCFVFDVQKLMHDFNFLDLTDNGEAEIRFPGIKNFDKYLVKIYVTRKVWERGDGWEGFYYRAVSEWFPESLKKFVEVRNTISSIGKSLKIVEAVKYPKDLLDYAKKYKSSEALLRLGGFADDVLYKSAFGFDDTLNEIDPKDLHVYWKSDMAQVRHEVKNSGLSPKKWSEKISLSKPIDVFYQKGKFWIDDGHHRYFAAKTLGKKLKMNLEIKENPIKALGSNDYDKYHRDVWNKAQQE